MPGGSLAGGSLWVLAHRYYSKVADPEAKSEKELKAKREKARLEFINGLLGESGIGGRLSNSLKLARTLVESIRQELEGSGYSVARVDFILLDRGLVGAGEGILKTIFEVGMTIDPLLGLPYYPGSTLKGAARSACTDVASPQDCDLVFGTTSHVAPVIYTSAYPTGCISSYGPCTVYLHDIVNPHYYKGGEPVEHEYEANPVPVIHLSISPGTVFTTIVAARSPDNRVDEAAQRIIKTATSARGKVDDTIARTIDRSPGAGTLLRAALVLLGSALYTGFAARSSVGYNVAKILSREEMGRVGVKVLRISIQTRR